MEDPQNDSHGNITVHCPRDIQDKESENAQMQQKVVRLGGIGTQGRHECCTFVRALGNRRPPRPRAYGYSRHIVVGFSDKAAWSGAINCTSTCSAPAELYVNHQGHDKAQGIYQQSQIGTLTTVCMYCKTAIVSIRK